MARFGTIPPEPARITSLDGCAPGFAAKVQRVLLRMQQQGHDPVVFESLRTPERTLWLYGFGRQYDDGRGVVTNVNDPTKGYHPLGLAADVISRTHEWDAPAAFWNDLRAAAIGEGLYAGADFTHPDRPHIQWHGPNVPLTPTATLIAARDAGGLPAVWAIVGAA